LRNLKRREIALMIVGVMVGAIMLTPASAHVGGTPLHLWRQHLAPLAKKVFYTKTQSNARFANAVAGTDKAKNADKLDGMDSTTFAPAMAAATAFGGVQTDGTKRPGGAWGNWTSSWNAVSNWYVIDFDVSYSFASDVAVVTPVAFSGACRTAHPRIDDVGGNLLVRIFDAAGNPIQCGFSFIAVVH
jgi:hypothetical protein